MNDKSVARRLEQARTVLANRPYVERLVTEIIANHALRPEAQVIAENDVLCMIMEYRPERHGDFWCFAEPSVRETLERLREALGEA